MSLDEVVAVAVGRCVEADELLEWVEFVKPQGWGWEARLVSGELTEIECHPPEPPDSGNSGWWAPTLREALALAKKASEP